MPSARGGGSRNEMKIMPYSSFNKRVWGTERAHVRERERARIRANGSHYLRTNERCEWKPSSERVVEEATERNYYKKKKFRAKRKEVKRTQDCNTKPEEIMRENEEKKGEELNTTLGYCTQGLSHVILYNPGALRILTRSSHIGCAEIRRIAVAKILL